MSTGGAAARPLPRTRNGRARRQAIIEAAADLMYRDGVSGTSLDDVLAHSGAGKSQLYLYFDNKTDLVRHVVGRQLELVLGGQPRLAAIATSADLRAWADEVVALHSTDTGPLLCPLGSLAAEVDRDPALRPVVADAFRAWQAPLTDAFRTLQDAGAVRADLAPEVLAQRTLIVLQGGMLLAATFGDAQVLADGLAAHLDALELTNAPPARSDGTPGLTAQ